MTELRQDADNKADSVNAFGDAGVWAPRLRRLLTEQEELYESLERLAKGQSVLIADGDAPGLLSILAERHTVLTALQRSNDEMAPFRERWNDLMQELPDAERGTLADRVESIAMRIERIAASDEADREALTARRVEVSDRLTDVTRSKSAVSAYGNPQARGPRFQDREG